MDIQHRNSMGSHNIFDKENAFSYYIKGKQKQQENKYEQSTFG